MATKFIYLRHREPHYIFIGFKCLFNMYVFLYYFIIFKQLYETELLGDIHIE